MIFKLPQAITSRKRLLISLVPIFAPSVSLANSDPELTVPDRVAKPGSIVEFVVVPTDPDGVVPGVFLKNGPVGARLDDNLDGTRTFNWEADEVGKHEVTFTVTDGQHVYLQQDVAMTLTVDQNPAATFRARLQPAPKLSSTKDALFTVGTDIGDVQKILTKIPVSSSQLHTQQTPIDVGDGYVYISNIEVGSDGDGRRKPQKTVLRQGTQTENGDWVWEAATIDERTIYDEWHTAPSVAVDRDGYVHVAYNMHYMPWQYKRSVSPHDVSEFDFLGQAMTEKQRKKIHNDNDYDFPTLGSAAIPGNQITYPAFYKDNNQDLYVSYRFAATPDRHFAERTVSAGIASYDVDTKKWTAAGEEFPLKTSDYAVSNKAARASIGIAGKRGWTAYHPRILFDDNNQLMVHWFWRLGTGGSRLAKPCLIMRADRQNQWSTIEGDPITLPVSPSQCGNIGFKDDAQFLTIGSTATHSNGTPHLLLSPEDESREIVSYNKDTNEWISEKAPSGATEIFFDKSDTLWAVSSGLRIFKRPEGDDNWEKVYDEGERVNCYPSAVVDKLGNNAFIYSQACNEKSVTVYAVRLR